MDKIRVVGYLDPKQAEQLKKLCDKTGARPAEIVRRAIADYLKRNLS